MNDQELLDLAAKAAGITGGWGDKIEYHNGAVDLRDVWILEDDDFVPWNPLTDDGDALRLAESLGFTICMNGSGTVSASDDYDKSVFATQSIHECGGNRLAATRRAIVRAAAEIGRTK